jgi:hypothetical protein
MARAAGVAAVPVPAAQVPAGVAAPADLRN